MKDVIIVSGGNIQRDFALDFLQKNKKENVCLIAADKGVEFFIKTDWVPDVAVGDFDSLSAAGEKYLDSLKETEIVRLKPEKDDSDTQSAVNFAIDRGAKNITIFERPAIESTICLQISDCWCSAESGTQISR